MPRRAGRFHKHDFSQAAVTDAHALARIANNVLHEYVAVHDGIFGGSLWKIIRSTLPIPFIFQPIPYSEYQDILICLSEELDRVHAEASAAFDLQRDESAEARFVRELVEFCQRLGATLEALTRICAGMVMKAKGRGGPSLREYKASLEEYDRLRAAYVSSGERLNVTYSRLKRTPSV
jgi:hypothetical protein